MERTADGRNRLYDPENGRRAVAELAIYRGTMERRHGKRYHGHKTAPGAWNTNNTLPLSPRPEDAIGFRSDQVALVLQEPYQYLYFREL